MRSIEIEFLKKLSNLSQVISFNGYYYIYSSVVYPDRSIIIYKDDNDIIRRKFK